MDTRPNDAALASSVGSRGQGLSSYEELEKQARVAPQRAVSVG